MPADNTQYSIVLPLRGEALYKLLAVHFDVSISWLSQVGEVNHGGHDSYTKDQPHIIWHVVSSLNLNVDIFVHIFSPGWESSVFMTTGD